MVSVVVPCRNEEKWLAICLESLVQNDYPKDRTEVLVVDGMSDDGTRLIVQRFADRYPHVRIVDNVKKITPSALNLGITNARGSIIVRADAHAEFPPDYISSLVRLSLDTGGDCVGGVLLTCPANDSAMAQAIAIGLSHPMGVGDSYYRIGSSKLRWGEPPAFGCFRRDVFERFGMFDEQLARNQDDEFNSRIKKQGAKFVLFPKITCRYRARDSLGKLWRMLYQYGYFKPLVVRKLGKLMTARQVAPPTFAFVVILSSIVAAAGLFFANVASLVAAGVLALVMSCYLLALATAAARAVRRYGLRCGAAIFLVLPAMHSAYGLGYLRGVLDFLILRKRQAGDGRPVPITR
jgi:glycosyltransferase involved in cell wall biosynthesis